MSLAASFGPLLAVLSAVPSQTVLRYIYLPPWAVHSFVYLLIDFLIWNAQSNFSNSSILPIALLKLRRIRKEMVLETYHINLVISAYEISNEII